MKRVLLLLFVASFFSFTACDGPNEERVEDVSEELEDVAEERDELNEEIQEYNEEVAEEMDTTTVVE